MTDTPQSLRADIAYMRSLADEGIRAPLLAGPALMMSGIVFGAASLCSWIGIRFLDASSVLTGISFFVAMAVHIGLSLLLRRARRRKAGYDAVANQAAGKAWNGIGVAIIVLSVATYIICYRLRSGLPATLIPSVVLVMYGAAWTVAAAMSRQRFLWIITIASYAAALGISFTVGSQDHYLWFAIALLLTAFAPGYVLYRRETHG